jgi:hypothetical protein
MSKKKPKLIQTLGLFVFPIQEWMDLQPMAAQSSASAVRRRGLP